ncbi:unnamed protein product, partial [Brenthis ino]
MCSRYFYLNLEINLSSSGTPELIVQSILQQAIRELFGECCGARADVLRVSVSPVRTEPARVLLRVRSPHLRHLRAAIALSPANIRVIAEAPTLQALV